MPTPPPAPHRCQHETWIHVHGAIGSSNAAHPSHHALSQPSPRPPTRFPSFTFTPSSQVHSVVGYGAQLDDGTIDYVSLAPKAAQIIERLGSEEGQMERWEKVQALQDGDRVHGMYKDDFDEALRQALSAYDPSGTGAVSIQDWVDALSNSPIGFTAREIGGLFSLVRPSPSTPTLVLGLTRHPVTRVSPSL